MFNCAILFIFFLITWNIFSIFGLLSNPTNSSSHNSLLIVPWAHFNPVLNGFSFFSNMYFIAKKFEIFFSNNNFVCILTRAVPSLLKLFFKNKSKTTTLDKLSWWYYNFSFLRVVYFLVLFLLSVCHFFNPISDKSLLFKRAHILRKVDSFSFIFQNFILNKLGAYLNVNLNIMFSVEAKILSKINKGCCCRNGSYS